MRIALLSDIHGNLVALEAVLEDMQQHGPFDQVIVAGDLVWSGPWPAEVVDRVRQTATAVIQGNTDAFFLLQPDETPPGKSDERFRAHLTWMMDRLGPERATYLAQLPFAHRISPAPGHDLLVVHANPTDLTRPIVAQFADDDLDGLLLTEDGREPDWRALAYGHIHVPAARRWRERLLVDVASVGLPMDGDQRAAYAIMTWDGHAWSAEHRRVFYPVPVVVHEMRTSGMPRGKHFAERLLSASYGKSLQLLALVTE
ncbi:MAG: metallophosphatase family protein [Anaerolineae bacterium]|nr:metallophosphatase family protein [Anaerolineae bacterium]